MTAPLTLCGILFPHSRCGRHDESGCLLPSHHDGPHQFIQPQENERVTWETDWGCDCEDCQSDDTADWCVVYQIEPLG